MSNRKRELKAIDFGKVPPQNIELEEFILGAIILESTAFEKVENILKPECFYKDHHAIIYNSMMEMTAKQMPIDLGTLSIELQKAGKIEEIGGGYFLTQLMNKVGTSAHIETHAFHIFESYLKREAINIGTQLVNYSYDSSNDIEDVISNLNIATEKLNDLSVGDSEESSMKHVVNKCMKSLDNRMTNPDSTTHGIPSGLNSLDDIIIAFKGGKLIIIGGRPGSGKTSLAMKFAKTSSEHDKHAVIFSLEMDNEELGDKIIKGESDVDSYRYEKGTITDKELVSIEKSLYKIENMKIIIDDKAGISIRQLKSRVRRLHKKGKCDMIVIDYLQLMNLEGKWNDIREQLIATASRDLKVLAKELNIPIILLAQLSRKVEDRGGEKRPQLADIRESGAIEQDADIVMFSYCPEIYGFLNDKGEKITGVGEIIVAKNRGGRLGEAKFYYNPSRTKITSEPQELAF